MANKKITELIELTTATENDVLPIVDLAVPETKKIKVSGLKNSLNLTRSDVGLSNVDNTSDVNKPISNATQTALDLKADDADLQSHITDLANPHQVTKSQVGLSEVDNTSDANKPISIATQDALNLKANSADVYTKGESDLNFEPKNSNIQSHISDTSNPHSVTKAQVGLSSVPNVDATLRSNHTGTQLASTISDFESAAQSAVISQSIVNNDTTHAPSVDAVHDALASEEAARISIGNRVTDIENDYGVAGGLATLDISGKIPNSMLPGNVLEYKGTWDASTNTPTLQNGPSNPTTDAGHIYRVSAAGTVNFGAGDIVFYAGDDVILSESLEWQRSPGGSLVVSVNGFQGDIVLTSEDISLTSSVASATNVQSALENIYTSVSSTMTNHVEALDPHPQYETSTEVQAKVDAHANLTNNPHSVTKAQVGLGDVDNISAASLRDRSTHTGTQLASTISDFTTAVQSVTIDAAKIDGGVVSNAEFATLEGINTATTIQQQINEKQDTITGAASSVVSIDLTPSSVVTSDSSGKITNSSVTTTTLGYLDATSSIQTQLNEKEPTITAGTASQYYRGDKTFQTLDKTAVGLSDVDNVSAADLRTRSTHTGNESSLTFDEISQPSAPASGATLYSESFGGRQMMGQINKDGRAYPFQPHIGQSNISLWLPNANANTSTVIGQIAPTATGTATARTIATTNSFTWQKRIGFVSAAAISSSSGLRSAVLQVGLSNISNAGGFFFQTRFGISDAALVPTARTFVGLTSSTLTLPSAGEPSILTNIIGMGHDSTDANFQIMFNDGAGVATKIDLGTDFTKSPTVATDMYHLILYAAPNSTTVFYEVRNIRLGVASSGSINTNIPAVNQLLTWQLWRNTGSTAAAVGIDISSVYLETEY
jgi:hypothetical protein